MPEHETREIIRAHSPLPIHDQRHENERLLSLFLAELTLKNFSPHTIRNYRADVRLFLEFIGSEDVTQTTPFEARRFMVWLAQSKQAGDNMRQRAFYGTRSFFNFLAHEKLIPRSPFAAFRSPKVAHRLPRVPSVEEICRVIEGETKPMARAILETLYVTGCRVSELSHLKVQDIRFEEQTAHVMGKGRKERRVPLGEPAIVALRIHLKGRHKGYVFEGRGGEPMKTRQIWRIVKLAGIRAGLPRLHPHLFRHAFATHLIARGADIAAVGKLLGHESLATTEIYTQLAPDDLVRAYRRAHPEEADHASPTGN